MRQRYPRTDWPGMRNDIESALRECGGFPASVAVDGPLEYLEAGINHINYLFVLKERGLTPEQKQTTLVLRKLGRTDGYENRDKARASLVREAQTLQMLAQHTLPFAVPRFIAFVGDGRENADGFIETAVPGVPLTWFQKAKGKGLSAMEVVARMAAGVHRLPPGAFQHLPAHADARRHVLDRLERLDAAWLSEDPDASQAARWIREHLPVDRPAVLLHGDLLPQNIHWEILDERLGLLDWEYAAIGDPAYDLAIVSHGHRRPLKESGGLRRLVEIYRQAGGAAIVRADVVIHELLLVLHWLWLSILGERAGKREGHPPEFHRNSLRAILNRA